MLKDVVFKIGFTAMLVGGCGEAMDMRGLMVQAIFVLGGIATMIIAGRGEG